MPSCRRRGGLRVDPPPPRSWTPPCCVPVERKNSGATRGQRERKGSFKLPSLNTDLKLPSLNTDLYRLPKSRRWAGSAPALAGNPAHWVPKAPPGRAYIFRAAW